MIWAGQSEEISKALGFENGVTPHQTTIQRLFRRLNVEEIEAAGHVEKTDVESKSKGLGEQEEQEEKKQKSELAVASRLIQHIDWKGKVLTGDALYCQRGLCSALRASRWRLSVSGEGKSASTA